MPAAGAPTTVWNIRRGILDGLSFSDQHHPELEGDTALSALLHGKVEKVLAAAENTAGAFS